MRGQKASGVRWSGEQKIGGLYSRSMDRAEELTLCVSLRGETDDVARERKLEGLKRTE